MAVEGEGVSWWTDGTAESRESEWGLSFNRTGLDQAHRLKGRRQRGGEFERQV